ncbi:MAG: helix-turn-helix transcriptional regulator [Planctomycetes bacterium]|nr:helix-turn-helix transcriptional regulator [Planctomycetota bacterium]
MLGAELKKARLKAGLTQEELAFRADVHRTYVSMLEREKGSPTLDTLMKLCAALGIRASDMVRRLEEAGS